jgi:hypothetical protein
MLREYNFSCHIWYDQEGGDRGDKEAMYIKGRIDSGLRHLVDTGVTHIILSPMQELLYRNDPEFAKYIMPVFYRYMTEFCLP